MAKPRPWNVQGDRQAIIHGGMTSSASAPDGSITAGTQWIPHFPGSLMSSLRDLYSPDFLLLQLVVITFLSLPTFLLLSPSTPTPLNPFKFLPSLFLHSGLLSQGVPGTCP